MVLLNFLQGILLARWLGPNSYGIIALIMSYAGFIFTFFDARSVDVSIKYLSEFIEKKEELKLLAMCKLGYIIDFGITVFSFLIIAASARWAAAHLIHDPEVAFLLVLYGFSFIPRSLVATTHALLVTLGKYYLLSWLNIIVTAVRVVLVVSLVLLGFNIKGAIWGIAIGTIFHGILFGIIAYRLFRHSWHTLPFHASLSGLKGRTREIIKFLLYNDVNALLGVISKQFDMILLGYFRTPTDAGYYKMAKNGSSAFGYLSSPLQLTTYPELSRLWSGNNPQAYKQKLRQLLFPYGLLAAAAGLVCVPFLKWAILLTVGNKYLPALPGIQILWIFTSLQLAFYWLRPAYMAAGYIMQYVNLSVIATALTLAGFLVAIPTAGYIGASLCILIFGTMHIAASLIYLWKLINKQIFKLQSSASTGP